MATMVGKHGDALAALNDLLELEYDAIAAYDAAIERFKMAENKAKLTEFVRDHHRHVDEVSRLLTQMGGTPVTGGDAKMLLTKGKVAIGDMAGDDKGILMAMKTNEDDTVAAYETMSMRDDLSDTAKEIMKRGLADERKHKLWIQEAVSRLVQAENLNKAS